MARIRVFLALLLVAAGATFGGLALSGYYKPPAAQPVVLNSAVTTDAAQYFRFRSRRAFLASVNPVAVPAAHAAAVVPSKQATTADTAGKPKPAAAPARKPKPPAVAAKAKAPQQVAAWPWNLFGN